MPYQIYLLQVLALPAEIQIGGFRWAAADVPDGIIYDWPLVFDTWLPHRRETALGKLDNDVALIDNKLYEAVTNDRDDLWSNSALLSHEFWEEAREMAKNCLVSRDISLEKPDPDQWYELLPENLRD